MKRLLIVLFLLQIYAMRAFCSLQTTLPVRNHSLKPCPFVVFSPPKCGTHLAGKALSLLVNKNAAYYLSDAGGPTVIESLSATAREESQGSFMVSHHFTNEMLKKLVKKGYKIVFVVRDPRDQLISVANWLREGQWHWLPVSKISDQPSLITELIIGSKFGWQSVEKCYLSFEKMLTGIPPPSIHKIYFEKLVGPNGLGTVQDQYEELLGIANFLGIAISNEDVERVANNLYGGTKTFRDGSIGKWKHTFTPEQKEQFRIRYNYLLQRLGYEHNIHW